MPLSLLCSLTMAQLSQPTHHSSRLTQSAQPLVCYIILHCTHMVTNMSSTRPCKPDIAISDCGFKGCVSHQVLCCPSNCLPSVLRLMLLSWREARHPACITQAILCLMLFCWCLGPLWTPCVAAFACPIGLDSTSTSAKLEVFAASIECPRCMYKKNAA